jgi:hypothetical protein
MPMSYGNKTRKNSGTGLHDINVPKMFCLKQAHSFLPGVCIPWTSLSTKALFHNNSALLTTTHIPVPKRTTSVAAILKKKSFSMGNEQCNRNLVHPLNSFCVIHPRRSFQLDQCKPSLSSVSVLKAKTTRRMKSSHWQTPVSTCIFQHHKACTFSPYCSKNLPSITLLSKYR